MFEQVKALVFDVFGTVVDWREGVAREAGPFLARIGRTDIDVGSPGTELEFAL